MQNELNYIYEVWQCGSFSQAAEKLFLSQPALSLAVKRYEEKTDVQIFDRSQQPLRLTPAGEVVLRHIRNLRLEEKSLQDELHDLQTLDCGALRLAATQFFNCYVLPGVLRQFRLQYPKVDLTVYEQPANMVDQLLDDGTADACFHTGAYDAKHYTGKQVFSDYLVFAAPCELLPAGLQSQGWQGREVPNCQRDEAGVPLAELAALPYISLTPSNQLRERTEAIFHDNGCEPHTIFTAGQVVTAWHMVKQGIGCTLVSDCMAREYAADDRRFFPLLNPAAQRTFYAITRKGAYQSRFLNSLLQFMLSIGEKTTC